MKIINGKLVVFGNFDSIVNWNKKLYQVSNIASYNSQYWERIDITSNLKTFNIANMPAATNNDTSIIVFDIPDYDLIVRCIFPVRWETILKAPRKELPISSVTYLGNKWLFTRTHSDSLIYYDGKNFFRKKSGVSLGTSMVTIENKINVFQNVKVYNMIGQEVKDVELNPIGKTIQSISQWPRRMYFIRSTKGNFQKFLVH